MSIFQDASTFDEIALFEAGKEECIKEKTITLTKKDYNLFHYVYSGKGTLIINNKKYSLSKGAIFFIPTQCDAVYYSDNDDPWSYLWIGFGGYKVEQCLEHLNINIDNPIIIDNKKNYKKYFDGILSRYVNDGYLDMYSVGFLYQLLGEMIFEMDGKQKISSNKVTIQLAKDYIYNNYQFNITIVDIAKNAHVTPNHLSTIFQKSEGMSTKSFLIKVRMEKAVILLNTGQFKIKEVAKMVGYSNQLHFSNEFKRYYGCSPANYLKK